MTSLLNKEYEQLSFEELVKEAINNGEGELAENGALVVKTGERTGRSPKNRFVVDDAEGIDWNDTNRPVGRETFDKLWDKTLSYLEKKKTYSTYGYVGADPEYRLSLKTITEKAWHTLFAKTLFIRPRKEELADFKPDFFVVDAMDLRFTAEDEAPSDIFVGLDLKKKRVLVVGTGYGGEMKKSIFAAMNYLLPEKDVLPMHCSANVGVENDTALFFGLSGTGKTTLSADTSRRLIGDDEHGWANNGVFNFEGGCYAKAIRLSKEKEPQIYNAIKAGSILENVIMDNTGMIDYDDPTITENTRATYPVEHIPGVVLGGKGSHPTNIFFLTCDAFGVLPPIAELTPEMAMYHFMSGYTAKIAGTEAGVTEPEATFSACFGSPFLPRHPTVYAKLLGEKMLLHGTKLWLVNTGWSGGPYGVGERMDINITRRLLEAALDGELDIAMKKPHPIFQILVPQTCPGIDRNMLNPNKTWDDESAYETKAKHLAKLFNENFKQFQSEASNEIRSAGPIFE